MVNAADPGYPRVCGEIVTGLYQLRSAAPTPAPPLWNRRRRLYTSAPPQGGNALAKFGPGSVEVIATV